MDGQVSIFDKEREPYKPYWDWKGKEIPESIDEPKCVKISLSANHCYWYCPTCRGQDSLYKPTPGYTVPEKQLEERCRECGQKIYYDDAEIEAEPYYKKMVEKRDLVCKREKDKVFQAKKKELAEYLSNGAISKDKYTKMIKLAEYELMNKYDEAEKIRQEIKLEEVRQSSSTPYLIN